MAAEKKKLQSSETKYILPVWSAMICFCIFSTVTAQEIQETSALTILPTHHAITTNSDVNAFPFDFRVGNWNVRCVERSCYPQLNSTSDNVKKSINNIESIFQAYVEEKSNFITKQGLERLMTNLGLIEDNDDHDEDHENEEDHDVNDTNLEDDDHDVFNSNSDYECIQGIEDIQKLFYSGMESNEIEISRSDFYLMMPHLIRNLQNPKCRLKNEEDHDEDGNHEDDEYHDHGHDNHDDEHNHYEEPTEEVKREDRAKVWGIALVSVAIISLLSVVGIMTVPLMGYSRSFKTLLSFLVSLAVGTLIGDALLHLLPHAIGEHEHKHGAGGIDESEKKVILKSLVAVLGVYVFFLFESGMSIIRKRKRKGRSRSSISTTPKLEAVHSPTKSDDFLLLVKHATDGDSLLYQSDNASSSNKTDEDTFKASDSGIGQSDICANKLPSTSSTSSLKPVSNSSYDDKAPTYPLKLLNNNEHTDGESTLCEEKIVDHHHHHHHHGDIANAQGIKDLAWMIIAGDGLHNFSDGLAIGAAFSSSISAGLSTSLAIFFHELPHELGDFAILIDAGMSIKKALAYNGLCACLAFIGVIIGLLIGEHTDTVKLWILAVTAGGFLYVALVDMLPQMLHQCVEKDGGRRFIFQNIGFLSGVMIMLLIAWFEESFSHIFNITQDH